MELTELKDGGGASAGSRSTLSKSSTRRRRVKRRSMSHDCVVAISAAIQSHRFSRTLASRPRLIFDWVATPATARLTMWPMKGMRSAAVGFQRMGRRARRRSAPRRSGADQSGRTSLVEVGDTVKVRASSRRARIVAALSQDRYEVEYLPDRMDDPIDRDTVQSEGEGGIYDGVDLTPLD